MNTLDLIILAIIIICGIIGYIKGFWLSLISLVKYIAALIGTKVFSPVVTNYLWNSPLKDSVNNYILERFQSKAMESLTINPGELNISGDLFSNFEALGNIFNNSLDYIQGLINSNILKVGQSISSAFTGLIISALGILITFLGLLLIFSIITNIVNKSIKNSKKLTFTNNALGFLFNALSSMIVIAIVLIVIAPLVYSSSTGELFTQSLILKLFYSSNIYSYMLSSLTNLLSF